MDEDDPNAKRKFERTTSVKFKRIICIALGLFFGLIFLIAISSDDVETQNVRTSTVNQPQTTTEAVINEIVRVANKVETKTRNEFNNVYNYFTSAKTEVEEVEREAVKATEKELEVDIQKIESTLKKALEQMLIKDKGYSTAVVKSVEDEFSKKLKSTINDYIEKEGKEIVDQAEKNLDEIYEADVEDNKDDSVIKNDMADVKDYLLEETREEIASAGKDIHDNIREIAEEVEKEVLEDKLDIRASTEDLEDAEIDAVVDDAVKDMATIEKKELSKMESDVTEKIESISEDVQKVVRKFLMSQDDVDEDDVDSVAAEIAKRLREEAGKELKYKTLDVEDELEETLGTELQDIVDQDKYIIERAKQLGLKSSKENENKNDVDLIEDDIKSTKANFDKYLNDVTITISKELKDSIQNILEQIESDVFEENSIDLEEDELDDLHDEERTVTKGKVRSLLRKSI